MPEGKVRTHVGPTCRHRQGVLINVLVKIKVMSLAGGVESWASFCFALAVVIRAEAITFQSSFWPSQCGSLDRRRSIRPCPLGRSRDYVDRIDYVHFHSSSQYKDRSHGYFDLH